MKLPAAPLLEALSLRPYQLAAVEMVRRYLPAYRSGATRGAALVQMPTGSGKSGIIATLSRCLSPREVGCVLILAPRIALRKQIAEFVQERFFSDLDRHPDIASLPKTVFQLDGRIPKLALEDYPDHIFIATFQMIDTLRRAADTGNPERRAFFEQLKRQVTLVVVDEGHYEPASSWGVSIRDFVAPRVLFTATPYRNDLKAFDLDPDHWAGYTYEEAVQEHYLRPVRFELRRPTQDPVRFVDDVLRYYNENLADTGARVIIRCDDETAINQMATLLNNRRKSIVAIHENFHDHDGEPWQRRSVPNPVDDKDYFKDSGPIFWIHQFKLLEGIDHAQFRLLALFGEPLRNSRSLVQQVGRVVRNPDYPLCRDAFVLDHSNGEYERRWAGFRTYDATVGQYRRSTIDGELPVELGRRHHPAKGLKEEQYIEDVMNAHPPAMYVDGAFRHRLDLNRLGTLQARDEFLLPRAANFFRKDEEFELGRFADLLEQQLQDDDRFYIRYDDAYPDTVVFVYITLKSPPFLTSSYFMESHPGVIVAHGMPKLLSFYDSDSNLPQGMGTLGLAGPPSPAEISRVLRPRDGSRVVRFAMKNANLGHRAIRGRTITAASIADTVPALDDYGHVVNTVVGYDGAAKPSRADGSESEKSARRYLGYASGRVTEEGTPQRLPEYVGWLERIADLIDGSHKPLPIFDRYARRMRKVNDPRPRNVLVDVFEVESNFVTVPDRKNRVRGNQPMRIEDVCQDVTVSADGKSFKFTVTANDRPYDVAIEYDEMRRRYRLRAPLLDALFTPKSGNRKLLQYLNEEQSFRVLPMTPDVVYMEGGFYEIALPTGTRFNADRYHVGQIITSSPTLLSTTFEKGTAATDDNWAEHTLFGIISRLGKRRGKDISVHFGTPDILVCDDMGTEMADFILSEPGRVVFIHAKGSANGDVSHYSASKLADVCSQAVKNIHYLSMFNEVGPRNLGKWEKPWKAKGFGEVAKRIRIGNKNARLLWRDLSARIANPLTTREVWLFLGGLLSEGQLRTNLVSNTPEAVQSVMQLQSTMAAVGSIDAKLRVFCHP